MNSEICATSNIVVSLSDVLRIIDFEMRYQKEQLEDDCAYNALETAKEKIIGLQKWCIDIVRSRGMRQKVFPFATPPEEYISTERDILIKGLVDRITDFLIQNQVICINQDPDPSGMCDGITASLMFATKIVDYPAEVVNLPNAQNERM